MKASASGRDEAPGHTLQPLGALEQPMGRATSHGQGGGQPPCDHPHHPQRVCRCGGARGSARAAGDQRPCRVRVRDMLRGGTVVCTTCGCGHRHHRGRPDPAHRLACDPRGAVRARQRLVRRRAVATAGLGSGRGSPGAPRGRRSVLRGSCHGLRAIRLLPGFTATDRRTACEQDPCYSSVLLRSRQKAAHLSVCPAALGGVRPEGSLRQAHSVHGQPHPKGPSSDPSRTASRERY
jgi:hypothetical protein